MSPGTTIGRIVFLLPGVPFTLASAAGTLIVGLTFSRISRVGRLSLALPASSA